MAPPSPLRRSVTGRVSVTAHRGLSSEAPENTMRAFELADEAGCDFVEFDCHLTKDDEVIVIHDETLDRTTDGGGPVRERTLKELRALDAGSWFDPRFAGERLPTLDEVASWARSRTIGLSLEIKQPPPGTGLPRYPRLVERILETLAPHGMEARTLFHSFDHPSLVRVRELLPDATTAVLFSGGTPVDPLALARAADASGIHPGWLWLSADAVRAAHAAGMHVHAWGIPDAAPAATVERIVDAGADSVSPSADVRPLLRLLGR